jgi:hypothetical protein
MDPIQRFADRLARAGDWPVIVALAFAAGVLLTLLATGALS